MLRILSRNGELGNGKAGLSTQNTKAHKGEKLVLGEFCVLGLSFPSPSGIVYAHFQDVHIEAWALALNDRAQDGGRVRKMVTERGKVGTKEGRSWSLPGGCLRPSVPAAWAYFLVVCDSLVPGPAHPGARG